jgi:hypothetical protein
MTEKIIKPGDRQKENKMATCIGQYYLAHSKTGFSKISDGLVLRGNNFSVLEANYIPQSGDYLFRRYEGGDNVDALKKYGLELSDNCAGGGAFQIVETK